MIQNPFRKLFRHLRREKRRVVDQGVRETTTESVHEVYGRRRDAVDSCCSEDVDGLHVVTALRHFLGHVAHVGDAELELEPGIEVWVLGHELFHYLLP